MATWSSRMSLHAHADSRTWCRMTNDTGTREAAALVARVMSAYALKSCHCAPWSSVRSLTASSPGMLSYASSMRMMLANAICFHLVRWQCV